MPATCQWLDAKQPSFSEGQLKRMIAEITVVNTRKWSHETVANVTGGPRGSVTSVLTSLARGPLSEAESEAFKDIDFGNVEDPLVPDWQNLEKAGVFPALREAKAVIYAPGSLPKLRTALNHWLKYTATKARVGFLRHRVNDDPKAFMIESLLRQGSVADLVTNGCNADTAEQYAALFNPWHIGVMGYGLVATKSFDDPQFKRINQGLRRLHPATRIDRAAHPIEINAPVLRSSLSKIMEIYDEAGEVTATRWRRIEKELESGAQGGFNKDTVKGIVCSAVTELATDGLLRPGETLSKTDPIRQSDISFDHDRDGRLVSTTVMITPIKRYHKHVGDKRKCPVVIKAHRGGALRTAEHDRAVQAGGREDDSPLEVPGRENGGAEEGRGEVNAEPGASEGDGMVPCQMRSGWHRSPWQGGAAPFPHRRRHGSLRGRGHGRRDPSDGSMVLGCLSHLLPALQGAAAEPVVTNEQDEVDAVLRRPGRIHAHEHQPGVAAGTWLEPPRRGAGRAGCSRRSEQLSGGGGRARRRRLRLGDEAGDGDDPDGSGTEFLAAIAKSPRPAAEPELPFIESLFELDDDGMAIWRVSDGVFVTNPSLRAPS